MSVSPSYENIPPNNDMTQSSTTEKNNKLCPINCNKTQKIKLDLKNFILHKLCERGNADKLKKLLEDYKKKIKKYINELDYNDMAPLHYAAQNNHIDCVTHLVEMGKADIHKTNDENANAIHFAARSFIEKKEEENSVIQYLVRNGVQSNTKDKHGRTPFHYAVIYNNEVAALQLLKNGNAQGGNQSPLHLIDPNYVDEIKNKITFENKKKDLSVEEKDKMILFHNVCMEGNMRLAKLLVEIAEENKVLKDMLDTKDKKKYTALHYAVRHRHVDIVQLCLDKGANINAKDQDGKTPLHIASSCGSIELVAKLIDSEKTDLNVKDNIGQTPMHLAAKRNQISVIKYFIEKGADMESQDKDSYTPLLIAAKYGHSEVIELLMKKECNIFAKTRKNENALYLALEHNYPQAVETLLNGNLKSESLNKPEEKEYLIYLALKFGQLNIIKELCDSSEDELIKYKYKDSNTALHLAADSGLTEIVQLLLDKGADIHAQNSNKRTSLHHAAAKGHLKVVEILLENDSLVDPMDKLKVTPLYLACKNGHAQVVELLLEKGANSALKVAGKYFEDGCDSRAAAQGEKKGNSENECNALDAAIDNDNKNCAREIINSPNWKVAMKNKIKTNKGTVNTPMRKLIRKMPDIAEMVLNKCVVPEGDSSSEKYSITYNFEFLEDSARLYENEKKVKKNKNGVPYMTKKIQDNHPLMIMVKSGNKNLLVHPLVTSLLSSKWKKFVWIIYVLNLLSFLFFISTLLAYMLDSKAPYKFYFQNNNISNHSSTCKGVEVLFPDERLKQSVEICKWIIMIYSVLGILMKIFVVCHFKKQYVNVIYIMECFLYILATITVINISKCQRAIGIREPWQWQTGVIACLIGVLVLVINLRKIPYLGMFVFMMSEVTWTFVKFCPIFILLILAFAFAFYLLLNNQTPFRNVQNSILKTGLMAIGEFDFDSIFNAQFETKDSKSAVMYDALTYAIFIIFIIIMSIVIMNLLISLAINIQDIQNRAHVKRMASKIIFALNTERMLSRYLRINYTYEDCDHHPNKWGFFRKFFRIESKFSKLTNSDKLETRNHQKENLEQVTNMKRKIENTQKQIQMQDYMLFKIMEHLEIPIDYDELNEIKNMSL